MRRTPSANKVVALVTLLLCLPPLQAQAYTIAGVGLQSCGSWTAWRGQGAAGLAEQWVFGYLSGVAAARQTDRFDPLDETDADGVWAWIDNYCRKNPLDHIDLGAAAFVSAHPRSTPR
jgi:hypothetical protein